MWKWQKKGRHLHSFTIVKETQDYFLFTHPDICTLHPSLPSSLPTGWPSWITSNEPPGPLAACWVWPMGSPTGDRRFSSLPAQQWGSSAYVPLSQATTPIRWPSSTVRALVDFRSDSLPRGPWGPEVAVVPWRFFAIPYLFPLILPTQLQQGLSSNSLQAPPFWMSHLLPAGILKDPGRGFSFCGSRTVSQVREISVKGGGRTLYTFLTTFFQQLHQTWLSQVKPVVCVERCRRGQLGHLSSRFPVILKTKQCPL